MKNFAYRRAASLSEVVGQLGVSGRRTRVLAAGVDLLDLLKDGIQDADALISLAELLELKDITVEDGGVRLGATVTLTELANHATLQADYTALASAAGRSAFPQLRNRATLGGNLLQRPRCWYLRKAELTCLRRGGSFCLALTGENRYHALFGGDPCYIVHPSSLATALLALDAQVEVLGPTGLRTLGLSDLFYLPSQNPMREHTLADDELLTAVILSAPPAGSRSAYARAMAKQAHDWPMAEAAVRLSLAENKVTEARLVLGAVAPVPWRLTEVEDWLKGQSLSEAVIKEAAQRALAGASPLSQNAWKVPVAQTTLEDALRTAAGMEAET